MKLNYETCLLGKRCILVPYRPEHVPKYHDWMLDSHLLDMTGSEPLAYEEEVEMQQSWRDDDAKCTFIVLDRDACEGLPSSLGEDENDIHVDTNGDENDATIIDLSPNFVQQNLSAMVGDVNLFLSEEEQDETDEEDANVISGNAHKLNPLEKNDEEGAALTSLQQAELDIMLAEPTARAKGFGSEASLMMMLYGSRNLGIRRYFAKIKKENAASKKLFNRLGFEECNYVECFGEHEYEYRRGCAKDMAGAIQKKLGNDIICCKCKLNA